MELELLKSLGGQRHILDFIGFQLVGDFYHFQLERLSAPNDEFMNETVISLSFCSANKPNKLFFLVILPMLLNFWMGTVLCIDVV
jgi:hypothetical protein